VTFVNDSLWLRTWLDLIALDKPQKKAGSFPNPATCAMF
jgi:hypothetical protein